MGGGDTDWSDVLRRRAQARVERDIEIKRGLQLADKLGRGYRAVLSAAEANLCARALREYCKK